jgi:hypothetical protein
VDNEMSFIIIIYAIYWSFPPSLLRVTSHIFCSDETNHMLFYSAQKWNYWCCLL